MCDYGLREELSEQALTWRCNDPAQQAFQTHRIQPIQIKPPKDNRARGVDYHSFFSPIKVLPSCKQIERMRFMN